LKRAGLARRLRDVGDYNGDGAIDVADYNAWRSTLGNAVTPGTKADCDGTGNIDTGDFLV
jgi:dockerin type I repeat protein